MKGLLAVSAGIDRMNEIIGRVVAWAIFLAVMISATNAVVRKTFSVSSNAWLELQWYLFGAAFLGAAAYTLKQNEHVRIDVLYARLSRRTQHWIDLLGHLLFLMPFVLLMVWYLYPYTIRSFNMGEVSTNSGGLIIWPSKALLLAGFTLLSLQGISEIIKKIGIMTGARPDDSQYLSAHDAALAEVEAKLGEATK